MLMLVLVLVLLNRNLGHPSAPHARKEESCLAVAQGGYRRVPVTMQSKSEDWWPTT